MRKLIFAAAAAAALLSGIWFAGAWGMKRAISNWFEMQREAGWTASHSDLRTVGYPFRFDTTISEPELAVSESGLGWNAPFVQILMLGYQPNRLIAVWPERQTIEARNQQVTLTSERMRASIGFQGFLPGKIDRITAVAERIDLVSTADWGLFAEKAQISTRRTAGKSSSHDIAFEADGAKPSGGLLRKLDPTGLLPETIETLRADATIGFESVADDSETGGPAVPVISDIALNDMRMTWGRLDLQAAGNLAVDRNGTPEGRITLKASNWREILDMALDSGLAPRDLQSALENGLELLAFLGGSPNTLEVPLNFRDGLVSLGPIPLGKAPRLRLAGS